MRIAPIALVEHTNQNVIFIYSIFVLTKLIDAAITICDNIRYLRKVSDEGRTVRYYYREILKAADTQKTEI